MKKIKDFIDRLTEEDLFGRAAQTAFFLLLAIFPLSLFGVSMLNYFSFSGSPPEQVLPADIMNLITNSPAMNLSMTPVLIIGFLWSGSAGLYHLIKAVHLAYTGKVLNSLLARAAAMGYMLGFLLALGLSFVLTAYGQWFSVAASLLAVYVLLFSLYTVDFTPKKNRTPGKSKRHAPLAALLGAVLWSAATFLFELYMTHFSRYTLLYGSIGSVLGIALWLFIISLVVIFGAECGALLQRRDTEASQQNEASQ